MPSELTENWRKLNSILEERDRLFPRRNEENTSLMRSEFRALTGALIGDRNIDWGPDKTLVRWSEAVAERPIFICGAMKSGTTLLLELLDYHSKVIAMPGDSHMVKWIDEHRGLAREKLVDGLQVHWIGRFVNPTGQKPLWIIGKTKVPYLAFLSYLDYWLDRLPESERNGFLSAVLAYYCSNPKRPDRPMVWIEKTPGNEMKVDRILEFFGLARFIHIVRDPLDNIVSLKRLHELRGWTWNVKKVAKSVQKSLDAGLANQKRLGRQRYLLLRYEDLVRGPELEMVKVADFLRIEMGPVLLRPTVNGYPATSNSVFEKSHSVGKILKRDSNERGNMLTNCEKMVCGALLYRTAIRMGYSWHGSDYLRSLVFYLAYRLFRRTYLW
jgi:hypothetical protein